MLLINPGIGDFGRAFSILQSYRPNHYKIEYSRPRHNSVLVVGPDDKTAAVWHTPNQITIHFGNDDHRS